MTRMSERLRTNLWLLSVCRDRGTFRAMKRDGNGLPVDSDRLRLRGLPGPLVFRPGSTDVRVAWELFFDLEYRFAAPWRFDTIVDCGANVGLFLAFCVREGRRLPARYVGVEPDAEAFATLEAQTRGLGLGERALLLNAAAWERHETVSFDVSAPSWGRRVAPGGAREVQGLTISEILDAGGLEQCDLLKLDVEGGERAVLPTLADWGARVKVLVAELHDGLDFAWFASTVRPHGFCAYPAGTAFRAHPSAVREDVVATLGLSPAPGRA